MKVDGELFRRIAARAHRLHGDSTYTLTRCAEPDCIEARRLLDELERGGTDWQAKDRALRMNRLEADAK